MPASTSSKTSVRGVVASTREDQAQGEHRPRQFAARRDLGQRQQWRPGLAASRNWTRRRRWSSSCSPTSTAISAWGIASSAAAPRRPPPDPARRGGGPRPTASAAASSSRAARHAASSSAARSSKRLELGEPPAASSRYAITSASVAVLAAQVAEQLAAPRTAASRWGSSSIASAIARARKRGRRARPAATAAGRRRHGTGHGGQRADARGHARRARPRRRRARRGPPRRLAVSDGVGEQVLVASSRRPRRRRRPLPRRARRPGSAGGRSPGPAPARRHRGPPARRRAGQPARASRSGPRSTPPNRSRASRWAAGEQALVGVLAVEVDEPGGQPRRARRRWPAARRCRPATALGRHDPRQHQLVVAGDEAAVDACLGRPGPHDRRVGPTADEQLDRFDEHRLAGTRLTGHGCQTGAEDEVEALDDAEVLDVQLGQHAPIRQPELGLRGS